MGKEDRKSIRSDHSHYHTSYELFFVSLCKKTEVLYQVCKDTDTRQTNEENTSSGLKR